MNFKDWLLLTEAKKSSDIARELLGNNETLFNQIKSIIPTDIKQDLQAKLLPIAAYYYKQQPDLKTLEQDINDYANLVKLNKMQIITVNDDLTISNEFKDYLHWTQVIHGKQAEDKIINAPIPQGNLEDQELIEKSTDGRIKVYKANSVNQCIILGKGESFCISQPANTMFQSYRDTKVSTFYFVYDNTRTDDLAIVVVDATQQRIELTDRKNQTAKTMQDPYSNTPNRIQSNPQLYFKYLKEHGIDTSIFVNIPKSKEEEAEQQKLGETNYNLEWLKSLTQEEKSKYIGRGHILSNEQFDYLYENKFMLLLSQYVRTGRKVNDYQLEKVAKVRDLKDKYLHNRLIADQHLNDLSKQEYDLLNPKQKEEFYDVDADKKFKKAIRFGELEKLKEAIKDGAKISDDAVSYAASSGNLDIVKYLVDEKSANINDSAVGNAARSGNLDIVKYFVEKGARIDHFDIYDAAYNGRLDIVKYLVEKGAKYLVEKGVKINDYAADYAIQGGHLDILKYFVEKGAYVGDAAVANLAESGDLDIIKYLLGDETKDEKGNIIKLPDKIKPAKISDNAVSNAAENGHLDIVKYLAEKGAYVGDAAVANLAGKGHLDIIKYLLGDEIKDEKGNIIKLPDKIKPAKISDYAVSIALRNGDLDMVKYLVKKGANISDYSFYYAARSGNLDIVKYLVEKGAKIHDKAVRYAKKQEMKDYLMQKQKEQQLKNT